jgi:phage terminase small subunit
MYVTDKDIQRVIAQKKEWEKREEYKKRRKKEPLTPLRKAELCYDYGRGMELEEIREKYHVDKHFLTYLLDDHINKLLNRREELALKTHDPKVRVRSLQKIKDAQLITEKFLEKLSENDDETLTNEEALFCQLYVRTGNAEEAITGSNLDDGLIQKGSGDRDRAGYRRAILVRSSYLQEKPNVKEYIDTLRRSLFDTDDIDKRKVQELLIEEIYKMKALGDPRDKVNIRQTIELLGKTIGAFTEKVEIHEVDPSKSLDALIEMAKEAEVKELGNG